MFLRRLLSLSLALLMCALSPALAENTWLFTDGVERVESGLGVLEQMATDGTSLYLQGSALGGQILFRYTPGDVAPTLLWQGDTLDAYADVPMLDTLSEAQQAWAPATISLLASGMDAAWAVNYYTGKLGRIGEQGVIWSDVVLDLPQMAFLDDYDDYVYPLPVLGCWADGDTLSLVVDAVEQSASLLYRFDMETGEQQTVHTLPRFFSVVPHREGRVLGQLYTEELGDALVIADPKTGTEEVLAQELGEINGYPAGLAYDPVQDAAYYTRNGQVFRVTSGGAPELAAYLTGEDPRTDTPGMLLASHYVAFANNGVALRDLSIDVSAQKPLYLQGNYDPWLRQAFALRYPEIPLVTVGDDFMGSNDFAQDILAGGSADVYHIGFTDEGYGALRAKGYLQDLSASEAIASAIAAMHPVIQAALTDDAGHPVAVPFRMRHGGWTVDLTLWEENFPGQPLPATWAEWLTLYAEWEATHSAEDPYGFYRGFDIQQDLLYAAYEQFVLLAARDGKPADFTDPAFQEVFRQIGALSPNMPDDDDNDTLNDFANGDRIFQPYDYTLMQDPVRPRWVSGEAYQVVAYPVPVFEAGQQPLYPLYLRMAFLSPTATNVEGGLTFLAYCLEQMDDELRCALMADAEGPVEDPNFEKWDADILASIEETEQALESAAPDERQALQEQLAELETNLEWNRQYDRYVVTENALRYYQEEILPYLYANPDIPLLSFDGEDSPADNMYGILSQFLAGHLDADAALKELSQKARMMEQELQ